MTGRRYDSSGQEKAWPEKYARYSACRRNSAPYKRIDAVGQQEPDQQRRDGHRHQRAEGERDDARVRGRIAQHLVQGRVREATGRSSPARAGSPAGTAAHRPGPAAGRTPCPRRRRTWGWRSRRRCGTVRPACRAYTSTDCCNPERTTSTGVLPSQTTGGGGRQAQPQDPVEQVRAAAHEGHEAAVQGARSHLRQAAACPGEDQDLGGQGAAGWPRRRPERLPPPLPGTRAAPAWARPAARIRSQLASSGLRTGFLWPTIYRGWLGLSSGSLGRLHAPADLRLIIL